MTATAGHVEPRNRWLDAAVAAVAAVTFASLALIDVGGQALVLIGVTEVLFVATWLALGRRALNGGSAWPVVVAVLVGTCAVGGVVSPAFAVFQVIAFPVAWLVTPGLRSAFAANLAVALAIGVGYALGTSVVEAVAVQGLSVVFSVAMGIWISRIEERSHSRQALIDELTAAQTQLATLHHDAGAVAERERLARELHDTLTQSVAGIVMLAERAAARHPSDAMLGVLEDAARQALGEARAIIAGGASVSLEGGLAAALETLAERFRRETGLRVTVDASAEAPRGLEVVLLRCAQEALANVRKHAAARAVAIRLVADDGLATLTVTDDGRGPGDGTGFGIAGMRDRLALVAGDVALSPGPAGGSRLVVTVPVVREEQP